MVSIEDKLKEYLENTSQDPIEIVEQGEEDIDETFDMMVDLIHSLDADALDEDQQSLLGDILDSIDSLEDEDEDPNEIEDDEVSEKRIQKISRRSHLLAKKAYKRNKAKFKMINKKFRKTAAFKKWKKKHKRMVRAGRTKTKKYV
jgi:hypothetical protein